MGKGIAASGLLVLASVTPVLANAPTTAADELLPSTRVAETPADCLPGLDSWLPGTLQIDQRKPSANATDPQRHFESGPNTADCSIV